MHDRGNVLSAEEAWASAASLAAWARKIGDLPPTPELAVALAALGDQAEALAFRAHAAARAAEERTASAPDVWRRPRVLLVDDDAATLDALAVLLSDDFEVVIARTPLEALRLAHERAVEAIVTDLHMPGMDGLDMLGFLRADAATEDKPCLVLTGDEAAARKLAAFDLGAADYLIKPIDANELAARVRQRIAIARRLTTEKELQELDELTGLPNRRALHRRAARIHTEARATGQPLSIAFLDADRLKQINDTWGHASGDRAICAVADALRSSKRGEDFAARLGGDEFAVIMPGTDREGAARLIARFREELARRPIDVGDASILVHVSVGLADLGDSDREWESLLERADAALYQEKRSRTPRGSDVSELRHHAAFASLPTLDARVAQGVG